MQKHEMKQFDKEFNALCDKYRIRVAGCIYFSEHGTGEQSGVCVACKDPDTDQMPILAKFGVRLFDFYENHEQLFSNF